MFFDYIYKCLCNREIIEGTSRERKRSGRKAENKRKSISGFKRRNPKKGMERKCLYALFCLCWRLCFSRENLREGLRDLFKLYIEFFVLSGSK